jgi:hypothetical protein
MNTYVVSIGGQAVFAFRAEEMRNRRARRSMSMKGALRSDQQTLVGTDGKPLGMGSPAFRHERRRRHNMPNGSSPVTKRLATGKLTWMRATIRTSGTSI